MLKTPPRADVHSVSIGKQIKVSDKLTGDRHMKRSRADEIIAQGPLSPLLTCVTAAGLDNPYLGKTSADRKLDMLHRHPNAEAERGPGSIYAETIEEMCEQNMPVRERVRVQNSKTLSTRRQTRAREEETVGGERTSCPKAGTRWVRKHRRAMGRRARCRPEMRLRERATASLKTQPWPDSVVAFHDRPGEHGGSPEGDGLVYSIRGKVVEISHEERARSRV